MVREVTYGVDTMVVCHEDHRDVVLLDFNQTSLPIATPIATLHRFVPKTHEIGCTSTYRDEIATLLTQLPHRWEIAPRFDPDSDPRHGRALLVQSPALS